MNLSIDFPKNFHFRRTAYSHGWYRLLPFEIDEADWRLSYVFSGGELKQPVTASVSEDNQKLKIEITGGGIGEKERAKILRDVRHIFRLDDDLGGFYRL